jgi:4-hydroxy-tetrahydrodipicolinate reductase
MIKAVVTGAAGRMGSQIIHLIQGSSDIQLQGAVEHQDHPLIGKDAGETSGCGRTGVPISGSLEWSLEKGDVLIDFTDPKNSMENLKIAARHRKAAVIGTTGFNDEQRSRIKELASEIPCVLSPNMSVGVNVVFKALRDIARVTGNAYDVEISEIHHRHKKDAPSGTAMRMAQVLAEVLGQDLSEAAVYSRKGISAERKKGQIGIQSLRGGDVVGDHTVVFAGPGERIEITHRAHSRENFARGALIAAAWAVSKKPGLYDMQDVLDLK